MGPFVLVSMLGSFSTSEEQMNINLEFFDTFATYKAALYLIVVDMSMDITLSTVTLIAPKRCIFGRLLDIIWMDWVTVLYGCDHVTLIRILVRSHDYVLADLIVVAVPNCVRQTNNSLSQKNLLQHTIKLYSLKPVA